MRFNLIAGVICGAVMMGCLAWILTDGGTPLFPLIGVIVFSFVFGILVSEAEIDD
jgi:hypothetical protein